MAVSTINPWSAGAVVLDQRPFMQFYERQMARQQAKDDALNNYFKDLGKNLTTSGMRSQDVPTLLKKQQEWQQIGIQNKGALLNPKVDNGQTLMDYQQRYNDMQALINESKNAAKSMDEIGKMKLKPEMSYIFQDPNVMDQIQKHELAIGDPNRQGINLATFTMPPQPITTKDLEGYQKYLTGGVPFDKIPGQTENLPGFKTRTPIHQQYSPENQMVIGQHAINAYDTDPKWRREAVKYFDELKHNPQEYLKANTLHKQLYGNDIDSPKEAWAAKGILDNNMKATEYLPGKDDVGMALYLDKMRTANDLWLAKEKKKIDPSDAEQNNAWLEGYWRNRIQPAKQGRITTFSDPDHPLQMKVGYEMKPDRVMLDALSRKGKQPDRVYVTPNNEIYPVFFSYSPDFDEKGKKVGISVDVNANGQPIIDKELSQPMDLEQALISTGYKTSSKGKQLSQTMNSIIGNSTEPEQKTTGKYPLPAGKPRTVKQGSHIYTWSDEKGTYE